MLQITEDLKLRYSKIAMALNSDKNLIEEIQVLSEELAVSENIFKQASLAKQVVHRLKLAFSGLTSFIAAKATVITTASIIKGGLTLKISGALINVSLCTLGGSMIGGIAVIAAISGIAGLAVYKAIESMDVDDRKRLESTTRMAAVQIAKFCSAINVNAHLDASNYESIVHIDNSVTAYVSVIGLVHTMELNEHFEEGVKTKIERLKEKGERSKTTISEIKENLITDPQVMVELSSAATERGINKDFRSLYRHPRRLGKFNARDATMIRLGVSDFIASMETE